MMTKTVKGGGETTRGGGIGGETTRVWGRNDQRRK